jgi:predicted nucleic acid-binding protein
MAIYTLDTSAILAYVRGEQGEDIVEEVLRAAEDDASSEITVPFLALMEVEYILRRSLPIESVEKNLGIISAWPINVVESSEPWRRVAAIIKARGKLSLADAWVASLALMLDAELVHKDPEFDAVPGLKALKLPYDNRQTRMT